MIILKLGSRGDEVKVLLAKLNLPADGIFGQNTEKAVKLFLGNNGLTVDGIVGEKTWNALNAISLDKSTFVLLLDNGHGSNTLGKCSPDKSLFEYKWCREVVSMIAELAKKEGIKVEIITPETTDIPLNTRTSRINTLCTKYGTNNCLVISVHINAAGSDGKWHTASGWSGWVAPNASSNSKKIAAIMYKYAVANGLKGNRAPLPGNYWTGNFAMVRDPKCPAVLTENLFLDNKEEVAYLLSEAGKQTIAKVHIDAIKEYINEIY